jgi:hypothetical protein
MNEALSAIPTRQRALCFSAYTDMLLFERNAILARAWIHFIRDQDAE